MSTITVSVLMFKVTIRVENQRNWSKNRTKRLRAAMRYLMDEKETIAYF